MTLRIVGAVRLMGAIVRHRALGIGRIAALLALVGASAAHAQLARKVVDSVKAATVFVEVTNRADDGEEATSTGSGVVFDPKGLVLTNQHVVDDRIETAPNRFVRATEQTIRVYFDRGTHNERSFEVTVVRQNRAADLALLQLPQDLQARGEGPYPFLPLGDSDQTFETETVYAAGHPLGLQEVSLRTGTITAKRTFGPLPYLEHSVNVEHGSSGGPIVDDKGEIIGLVSFTLADAKQNTNFAIPSSSIKAFLNGTLPEQLQEEAESASAYLQALLDQCGLSYNVEDAEKGVFSIPYRDGESGTEVKILVSATPQWVLAQIYLGPLSEDSSTAKRMLLYKALLQANFSYYIGKFGLDNEGGVWLEHHIARQDLTGPAFAEYVRTLATLALGYQAGELNLPK